MATADPAQACHHVSTNHIDEPIIDEINMLTSLRGGAGGVNGMQGRGVSGRPMFRCQRHELKRVQATLQ